MENYSKSEILQMVEEEDVEFIRLQFTDMFGVLKNVAIPSSRLIKAMENRCTIDTASLDGFTGGSTHLPYIDRIVSRQIGCPILLSHYYELCTVYGLKEIITHDALHHWAFTPKKQK